MEIVLTKKFKENFNKMPHKIQTKFEERLDLFIKNPAAPILKAHPLKGYLVGYRSFSITGDHRVIYKIISPDGIKLVDVGRHTEIY